MDHLSGLDDEAWRDAALGFVRERLAEAVRDRGEAHLAITSRAAELLGVETHSALADLPGAVHLWPADTLADPPVPTRVSAPNPTAAVPGSVGTVVRTGPEDGLPRAVRSSRPSPGPPTRVIVHAIPAGDAGPAAARYAEALPERLDLVVLDLGADGETAALFPGDPAVDEEDAHARPTFPRGGRRHVTLTLPAINRARARLWVARGADRAEALAALLAGDPGVVAGRVNPEGTRVVTHAEIPAIHVLPEPGGEGEERRRGPVLPPPGGGGEERAGGGHAAPSPDDDPFDAAFEAWEAAARSPTSD